jgi:hypothetical protein
VGLTPQRSKVVVAPAIAIPTLTKDNFVCPESHLAVLREAMTEVSHLLVIGWRAAEDHFFRTWRSLLDANGLHPWPQKLARVCIVDQDDAFAAIAGRLEEHWIRASAMCQRASGFSEFMRTDRLEQFLTGV